MLPPSPSQVQLHAIREWAGSRSADTLPLTKRRSPSPMEALRVGVVETKSEMLMDKMRGLLGKTFGSNRKLKQVDGNGDMPE